MGRIGTETPRLIAKLLGRMARATMSLNWHKLMYRVRRAPSARRRAKAMRPRTVALLYFSAIPAFAVLYQFIWTDFYQGTAQFEPSTRQFEGSVRADLTSLATGWLALLPCPQDGHGFLPVTEAIPFVHTYHHPADGSTRIAFNMSIVRGWRAFDFGVSDPYSLAWDVIVPARVESIRMFPLPGDKLDFDGTVAMPVTIAGFPRKCLPAGTKTPPKQTDRLNLSEVAVETDRTETLRGTFEFPMRFYERFKQLNAAATGFSEPVSGGFSRFLYFSAVTITTVGFGDIVPLTTRARLLVATEAVYGVFVAGLFLNVLANNIGRPNTD